MNSDIDTTSLETMRPAMLKFARFHLSHLEDAEDCVQDTFLAFCASPGQFDGRASFKTYLFGILKNKVMDKLRLRYRNKFESPEMRQDEFDQLFTDNGHWQADEQVANWAEPEGPLRTRQFLDVLDICLNHLPEKIAAVFSMKELMEMDASEICEQLSMSKDLYWQCMSRARKGIQLCMTQRWFGGAADVL